MNDNIKKLVNEWKNPPFDENTMKEIEDLEKQADQKELIDRFYKRLDFGTGGLRGILGAGLNRMNIYTVGMATQGLANYIIDQNYEQRGVVISYDSRIMSDEFSKDTASILAANGIKSYLFDELSATPLCSFAIRKLKAASGIMITASHNPPKYNGYKVFWDDGGQVIPPHDKAIIDKVNKISNITEIKRMDFDKAQKEGLVEIIGDDIRKAYSQNLEKVRLGNNKSNIKIAFTPLHGAGTKIIPAVLKEFGFENVYSEEKQSIPDGNFPTVSYPNPEEKAAMELVLKLAKEKDADLILATDPDADRVGVGFKSNNGEYILINGNQIGTMLEYYILSRKKENKTLDDNGLVIKTIVTTELQREVANSFGCHTIDVLTGFKWIANIMKKYELSGTKKFIFGGEESFGYLPVDFVRDKDSIATCYFFAEMTDWILSKGSSLEDFLNEIYINNHLYVEDLKSLTFEGKEGMEKISEIMKNFRENPPVQFNGIDVEYFDDIKLLKRTFIKTKITKDINDLPASNVLQFYLADDTKITLRPSGTEPKIKFYFSVKAEVNTDKEIESKKKELQSLIDSYSQWLVEEAKK